MTEIEQFLQDEVKQYWIADCPAPRTVLDIGANVGAFSKAAAERWPGCEIFAYEPMPENVERFKEVCRAVPPGTIHGTIHISECAVRSFNGHAVIRIGDMHVTNSFHQLGRQTCASLRVQVKDAAELPECDFVKIDTEGCEVEILERLRLGKTQALACEYHREFDADRITEICEAAGLVKVRHVRHWGNGGARDSGILHFLRGALGSKTTLFVAAPIYGAVDPNFMKCMQALLVGDLPCSMEVKYGLGDSLVSRARNVLTADFLETNCTHLLFIDSDLIFSVDHIRRLMSFEEEVVGGFYPKKQAGPVQWVVNRHDPPPPVREDGLQELRYIGTGFLRVARCVFERMIERWGDSIRYKPDHSNRMEYDFWSVGVYPGTGRYLSEDWYFCQRWLDLGGKVWGDTRTILKHCGAAIYPLPEQVKQIEAESKPASVTERPHPGPLPLERECL